MIKIERKNLPAFFKAVADKMPLYLPIKTAGEVNFGYYTDGAEVDIDTLKTVKSPKGAFFPQSEDMMRFRIDGKNLTIEDIRSEKPDFVIFGVRACDYKAFCFWDSPSTLITRKDATRR